MEKVCLNFYCDIKISSISREVEIAARVTERFISLYYSLWMNYDWGGYDMIWYICLLQLGSHPVAVAQYTFTHRQYTERHKTNNT